jgi:hypothetical protein
VALPQPERSEHESTVGGIAPIPSLAAAHPAGAPPGAVWRTVCAWCGRAKVAGRWIDAPDAEPVNASGTDERLLSHGICPSCFDQATATAEQYRRARDES